MSRNARLFAFAVLEAFLGLFEEWEFLETGYWIAIVAAFIAFAFSLYFIGQVD